MSRISLSPKTALLKDYAILLLAGLAALLFAVRLGFSEVAWSDEAAYTVVARNLAEHGSLLTTLYPPETILRGGYPQRDVHLPGFMLLLALPASVFGPTAAALLLPARLAFLLSGLLMFWAGRRLFSPMVGYASALAFWSFPLFFAYANTVMAELPLVFVSLACFAVWLAARQRPRLPLLAALAVLLAAGTLVRETFVVFLPAALAVVRRWPPDGRRRAGLFFTAGLVLLAGVVCLLSLHRSYYPNTFNEILARGDWRLVAAGFGDNFVLQASRYASRPENFPQDILRLLFPALVAAGAAAF
ncbi:MAG: ArnT family glycosyltransferase, partial [Anaerolineae bacterium]